VGGKTWLKNKNAYSRHCLGSFFGFKYFSRLARQADYTPALQVHFSVIGPIRPLQVATSNISFRQIKEDEE